MHNQENVGLCFCAVFTKLTKIYCKICRYFKLLLTYGKIKNIMNLQYKFGKTINKTVNQKAKVKLNIWRFYL